MSVVKCCVRISVINSLKTKQKNEFTACEYFVEENSFGAYSVLWSENQTFFNVIIFMNYNMDQYGQHAQAFLSILCFFLTYIRISGFHTEYETSVHSPNAT